MRPLRIAIYHNLASGGALRALAELTRRLSGELEIDLYEGEDAADARRRAPMGAGLVESCRQVFSFPMPPPRLERLPLAYAHKLRALRQLADRDRVIAAAINNGAYDLAFVNPCAVRYTPAVLQHLGGTVVYFMQEPRRSTFESPMRDRRRPARRAGPWWRRVADGPSWALAEQAMARADKAAAAVDGTYVLCNSYFSAERILSAYGVRARVSYLGVDVQRFCPGERSAAVSTGPFVLSVGRLDPTKGHLAVVKAVARIPADKRPAVHVVGSGSLEGSCAKDLRRAATEGSVELELVRESDDDRLIAEYRAATATVCAAELEPFGLTSLESLACGTPVVAIRQGGFREVVSDGVNGYLVEPSIEGLADGIGRAVASPSAYSPHQLRSWVIDGRWTWDDAALRLRGHFDAAVEASAGRVAPALVSRGSDGR